MPPLPHRVANLRAGFEHERLQVVFERVGGGSSPTGPAPMIAMVLGWSLTVHPSRIIELIGK